MRVTVTGPALAVQTCARRMAPLVPGPGHDVDDPDRARASLELDGLGDGGEPLEVDLTWYGSVPLGRRPGCEAAVQALAGLMQAHGRDADGPRRMGLEVVSVATGVLATQAALAAVIGRGRGVPTARVGCSVLQGGLALMAHRIAADSSGSEWQPVPEGPAPGPPFRSADGRWFEIETLDASAWRAFWERLGGGALDLQWAWRLFRPRYFRGTCTLPAGLHETLSVHPLTEIEAAADACGVSLSPVRTYDQVLVEPGSSWGLPSVEPLPSSLAAKPWGPGGSDAELPLAGLRIVESTTRLQGPFPTQLLQQLGAHVVRVEPPGGDPFRTVPPLLDGIGSFYRCFNRGKEVVELDLSHVGGRDALRDLIADADVFVQNWRPGKAAEWMLEAADVADLNPALVYGHASGWGGRPEAARMVGTDFLVQAYAGVGAGIRPDGEPPLPSRVLLTDYLGALVTGEALLRGLCERARTGRGQRVEGALLMGAMALQAHVLDDVVAGREKGRRCGRPVWTLLDRPLPTTDGLVVVGISDDADVRRLCHACGVDPDVGERRTLEPQLVERIAKRSTAEWEQRLTDAGVACAPVCTDIGNLPHDERMAGLFEPLAAGASVPAPSWQLSPRGAEA